MLSKPWTRRAQKKSTAKLCQDKVSSLHNSHFTEKTVYEYLSDILDQKAKDRCSNVAEESWVTVQAASDLCHFHSFGRKLLALHFLFSQGIFILLRSVMGGRRDSYSLTGSLGCLGFKQSIN